MDSPPRCAHRSMHPTRCPQDGCTPVTHGPPTLLAHQDRYSGDVLPTAAVVGPRAHSARSSGNTSVRLGGPYRPHTSASASGARHRPAWPHCLHQLHPQPPPAAPLPPRAAARTSKHVFHILRGDRIRVEGHDRIGHEAYSPFALVGVSPKVRWARSRTVAPEHSRLRTGRGHDVRRS